MTAEDIAKMEDRFRGIDLKLQSISGQIKRMDEDMVKRDEYNNSHKPLVELVQKHDKVYNNAIKGLMWLGGATLISAIVSPHWSAVVRGVMEFFK